MSPRTYKYEVKPASAACARTDVHRKLRRVRSNLLRTQGGYAACVAVRSMAVHRYMYICTTSYVPRTSYIVHSTCCGLGALSKSVLEEHAENLAILRFGQGSQTTALVPACTILCNTYVLVLQ